MKKIAITKIENYDTNKYALAADGDLYSYWKGYRHVRIKHEAITHIIQFPHRTRAENYQQALIPGQKIANVFARGHGTDMTTYEIDGKVFKRLNWIEAVLVNDKIFKSRATIDELRTYFNPLTPQTVKNQLICKYFRVPKGHIRRQINGISTEFLSQIPDNSI